MCKFVKIFYKVYKKFKNKNTNICNLPQGKPRGFLCLIFMTTGEKLKRDLGLGNFKYVMIQKVINFPIPFFIITVDSRRPSTFLGYQKVKQLKSSYLKKFKFNNKIFDFSNYKLTPPFEIEQFTGVIPSHGMIFVRDIAGEYFMNKGLYESSLKKVYYEEIC